jgi:hypothetical protein
MRSLLILSPQYCERQHEFGREKKALQKLVLFYLYRRILKCIINGAVRLVESVLSGEGG